MRNYFFAGLVLIFSACQTVQEVTNDLPLIGEEPPLRYSENPQVAAPGNRQYKKMTKNRMEEEADIGSQAGSMWMMDGQSSYLFTQNKTRKEGDVLNVKLEGSAQKQVETKVKVIKKLLKQIEEQERLARGEGASQTGEGGAAANGGRAPAAAAAAPKKEEDEKADLSEVQTIPTRIVEKMPDGNYRIKGAQPFMIDKREYKVIVIGMIRPEDYNDEGVSSAKLLDPQFDVVSIRRNKGNVSQNM